MKQFKQLQNDLNNSMVILPAKDYIELNEKVDKILDRLFSNEKQSGLINGHITEKNAMSITGYKATWFWKKRTDGSLPYKKLGSKVYYKIEDVENLMEEY